MPIGILIDALAVAVGGAAGGLLKNVVSGEAKERLNMVFGACSIAMGIGSVLLMVHMPAVIFAVILGTMLGLALRLGERITAAARGMRNGLARLTCSAHGASSEADHTAMLVTSIVLFCASGTGIYGALISGMTGDHNILITKAILDFFTAAIFACTLGGVVSAISIPQCLIFLALFACARWIYPLTTPDMIGDFKACGGIIMLCTGFRMAGIKPFPIADMLPSMILVMPFSWLWGCFVLPLVG